MIRKYLKMKKKEIEWKLQLYCMFEKALTEHTEMITLLRNLYNALKDAPPAELKQDFITAIARMVHEENQKGKQ